MSKFNGGWIDANIDSFCLLRDDIGINIYHIAPEANGYYYVEDGVARWYRVVDFGYLDNFKQFYINNGELSWEKPEEEDYKGDEFSVIDEYGVTAATYKLSQKHFARDGERLKVTHGMPLPETPRGQGPSR